MTTHKSEGKQQMPNQKKEAAQSGNTVSTWSHTEEQHERSHYIIRGAETHTHTHTLELLTFLMENEWWDWAVWPFRPDSSSSSQTPERQTLFSSFLRCWIMNSVLTVQLICIQTLLSDVIQTVICWSVDHLTALRLIWWISIIFRAFIIN